MNRLLDNPNFKGNPFLSPIREPTPENGKDTRLKAPCSESRPVSEYVVRCVRCHESFHSIHQLPYSGRCGHSQCKDCASKESICPVSDCRSVGSFRDPRKNILVTKLLEFIDKEEEKIIAEKKGIDEVTAKFPMATPVPRPRTVMRQENAPVSLSNPPPSPARLTKENQDNLSFDHKLIVTNLPPVTEIMLKGRFGQKVKCVVCTDFAHQPSGQAYLSFATREEAETAVRHNNGSSISGTNNEKKKMKACFFHKKGVYEGLLLTVQPADRQQYGTWIGGIPHYVKKEEITMFIQQNFGDRYYTINYDPKPPKPGCAYVNFKDDFDRTQFINNTTNITFPLSRGPQIKEFKKEIAPQNEDSLDVVIKIPEGIPSFELKSMFQLCGIRKASVMNTENSYTLAYITLTRSGYEIVKRFDHCKIKHWPAPIRVALKNEYNIKDEYPHGLLLRNFKVTLKLRDIEAKFFNHFGEDSVRLVRVKNNNSFLYLNCKKESDMDKILNFSGPICFEGNGPATFERCKGGGGNMKAAESMDSIASLATLSLRNQNRRALELPPVVWNITVENVDSSVDSSKLRSLFSKMGTVRREPSRVANNSYDIQLIPNL